MALRKDRTLDSGFVGNYWRISEVHFNADSKNLSCVVSLYKDAATRNAGSLPIIRESWGFSNILTSSMDACNPVKRAYQEIVKSIPVTDSNGVMVETNFFVDATNV